LLKIHKALLSVHTNLLCLVVCICCLHEILFDFTAYTSILKKLNYPEIVGLQWYKPALGLKV